MTDLTAVEVAEINKLNAEAEYFQQRARGLAVSSDDLERQERQYQASLNNNRIYSFHSGVDESTARSAMQTMGQWSREQGSDRSVPFTLEICSPGGSVIQGFALIDYIRSLRKQGFIIDTVGYGYVASMGAVLLQAGSTRALGQNAFCLIHEVSTLSYGKQSELEDEVEFVKALADHCLDLLAERSNLTKTQIKTRWKRRDWWLDANETLKHGFCDRVF